MSWQKYKLIGLDSNIFSYHFHKHPIFGPIAKEIFDALSINKSHAITSIITLTEILSVKVLRNRVKQLEIQFSEIPNLIILDVNHDIASEAAKIRREYNFRLPDALQLATAMVANAKAFVSNDQRLTKFKKLKMIVLSELKG